MSIRPEVDAIEQELTRLFARYNHGFVVFWVADELHRRGARFPVFEQPDGAMVPPGAPYPDEAQDTQPDGGSDSTVGAG